jgi:integrase
LSGASWKFRTEAAAKAGLRRKLVEVDDIRAGRARERSDQTVREAAPDWLKTRTEARRKDDKARLETHIFPFMGDKTLPEVTSDLIQRFIRHLEQKRTARPGEKNEEGRTLKPATINNVLITLRKMMNDLFAWLKTPADVARFLDACGDGWFRMACELAVYAGLRKGEVAGLVYDAIDHERGMIRVDRSYEGPTKSKHARFVPLAPELATSLKRWRLRRGGSGGSLVVLADGQPITEEFDLARRTRRACKRAGVPSVKFHELRDTHASHLAERVSLPIVGAVLGHADVKTTARYAHIDTTSLARDPRLHLTFTAAPGKVLPLPHPEPDCTRNAHDSEPAMAGADK